MPPLNTSQFNTIRIATRKSKLALWQAHHVADKLQALGLNTVLVPIVTKGDRILDVALSKVGGKGLFLKEIEDALIQNNADIAVHSMKDVPSEMPPELSIAAMLLREDPSDALLGAPSITALKHNAVVGTSSLRRQCQILALRPDLQIKMLRGNVDTRLDKLQQGEYDAIILATAGLKRLELAHHIGQKLPISQMLPAVAQGCVGIQCRHQDQALFQVLAQLQDTQTMLGITAERACNLALGGSCQAPIGVHGTWIGDTLQLTGLVGNLVGDLLSTMQCQIIQTAEQAIALGNQVANKLFQQGAKSLLKC